MSPLLWIFSIMVHRNDTMSIHSFIRSLPLTSNANYLIFIEGKMKSINNILLCLINRRLECLSISWTKAAAKVEWFQFHNRYFFAEHLDFCTLQNKAKLKVSNNDSYIHLGIFCHFRSFSILDLRHNMLMYLFTRTFQMNIIYLSKVFKNGSI